MISAGAILRTNRAKQDNHLSHTQSVFIRHQDTSGSIPQLSEDTECRRCFNTGPGRQDTGEQSHPPLSAAHAEPKSLSHPLV